MSFKILSKSSEPQGAQNFLMARLSLFNLKKDSKIGT